MFEALYAMFFFLWSGYANRHRGGGPPRLNHLIEKYMKWRPRSLFTAGVLMMLPAMLIYLLILGMGLGSAAYLSSILAVLWVVWGLNGWGSYMEIGRNAYGYRDRTEVAWIDWILYWVFGPKWIPEDDTKMQPRKFGWSVKELFSAIPLNFGFVAPDLIKSPTGEKRPLAWRQKRDWTGMTLRGLHAVWLFAFLAWEFNAWYIMWGLIPFSLVFGFIYKFFYSDTFNNWFEKSSLKDKIIADEDWFWHEDIEPHFFAESGAGLLWGITFILLFGILI